MLAEALAGLEATALATSLRGSTFAYPLVNAGHIVGIALLFGAIAAFDLRLMGAWRGVPVAALARVLVPVAAAGLALAALAGSLLFIVKATDYAASAFFQAKMALLALGLANVAVYHALRARAGPEAAAPGSIVLRRLLGATSLTVWLAVLVLGRLVGYF